MMEPLFSVTITDGELTKYKGHAEKIRHCLKNKYEYGICKSIKKVHKLLGLKVGFEYVRLDPLDNKPVPLGCYEVVRSDWMFNRGYQDFIDLDGEHVREFLVLADTCEIGDTVHCTPKLKKFLFEILSGESNNVVR